ncbi:MAG: phosphoribosyltransferase family protein, partial [Actinomycetes bacterium]
VARELGAPLDVVVVRKLGVPWQPELAFGAVGEGGVRVLNPEIARLVPTPDVEALTARATDEVARRVATWRGAAEGHEVAGRTVVLVDDGIATGATVRAAVAVLRARDAARVVLAVPVAARDVVGRLQSIVDDLVCLSEPDELYAVGAWYEDFRQVADAEVRALLQQARLPGDADTVERRVPTPAGGLPALVTVPTDATGLVVFAHGSGSSRLSPRNAAVAEHLHGAGLGTVLMDLLTEDEARDRARVFDIDLLASRLLDATRWTGTQEGLRDLPLGYFGASTGAAAALWAAADQPHRLRAVVSRGGRPDLAAARLPEVLAPTLLVVGERDTQVLALNRDAQRRLRCENRLDVVPGATHLFEEPGTLDAVAELATAWFREHLSL